MITLPNECFFEIFNNLQNNYRSLFSCLLVNRQWCRIIVPILWREPTIYFDDGRLIRTFLSILNDKEQVLLIPLKINLPNYQKPLFEYSSYATSVGICLNNGVRNWLYDEGYGANYSISGRDDNLVNSIKCSLIAMFLRTSKKLKDLRVHGTIRNKILLENLYKSTTPNLSIYYDGHCDKNKEGKTLAEVLNKSTTLKCLDISGNIFNYEGWKALAETLCINTTLTSLTIYNNNLNSEGAEALTEALCKNTALTTLDLRANRIGSKGAKALAKALCINTTLTSLSIYNNNLNSGDMEALAEALCKNIALTSLDLGANRIGSEGVKVLAKALYINITLTSLDLSYNPFDSEGAEVLAEALCKNTALTTLNLRESDIGSEGVKALAKVLCKNTTLTNCLF